VVVGQDTPVTEAPTAAVEAAPGSMRAGVDHVWPFHWSTSPVWSTAVQKVAVGHETPVNEEAVPNWLGIDHD
jgi:hypothetical protein